MKTTRIWKVISKGFLSLAVVALSSLVPVATSAADSSCTPPSSGQGTNWPTGSDSGTYTYQCSGAYAGEWTNPYYVFDPTTSKTTPLYAPDYSYNCTTGTWRQVHWDFSPADGKWYQSQIAASDPGNVATGCPVAATAPAGSTGGAGSSTSDPTSTSATGPTAGSAISNTGPDSNNASNLTGNNTLNLNNQNNSGVTNNITGVAASGNSLVLGNTSGGDATTGLTQNEADIVNMLQSTTNALGAGSKVATFTANINGNVNGDLLFDPATINSVQNSGPNSTNTGNTSLNTNLTVNNSTGAAINNNINLASSSGNASVADNTAGGNATSGAAQTIANVVNVIDSAITAGQSFIGTININGNLNGDILLPPDFINQLLADNVPQVTLTGPNSLNSGSTTVNNNTTVNNTNNMGINNNVTGNANSGAATVSDNTSGGSSSTGSATTSITAFNLTGSKVIGSNDILVFVNVTGKWVGLILNAPPGTTAAELGGGITATGPNSANTTNTNVNNNSTLNNTANEQINNNIRTAATSGNASVNDNTKGGNAQSGNANNAVNLMNVENSTLDLTGWFGILFINVFGTWNGSFGINTSAGDPIIASTPGAVYSPVMAFVPHLSGGHGSGTTSFSFSPLGSGAGSSVTGSSNGAGGSSVLAAAYRHPGMFIPTTHQPANAGTPGHINWTLALSGAGAFVVYLMLERLFTRRPSSN